MINFLFPENSIIAELAYIRTGELNIYEQISV